MSDKKTSQLPIGQILQNTIFPIVSLGVTSKTSFNDIITSLTPYFKDIHPTGGTYNTGTTIFNNNLTIFNF